MEASFVLALLLSSVIGVSLGLLGGGGWILAVPVLVYVTHVETKEAIGMSLAIPGVFPGARLAGRIPAQRLRRGFASFVLLVALALVVMIFRVLL